MINLSVHPDYATLCRELAAQIAQLVRQKPTAVIGFATGSSPLGIYQELIRLHREEGLSFAEVCAFNLDEYYPIRAEDPQSYAGFMERQLFNHIDIKLENCFIPSGDSRSIQEIQEDCVAYEAKISECGGIDFQILGIGRTGHIGFNEPGSEIDSRTRLVHLDSITRNDAANDFGGFENVPERAITMGIGTILEAKQIALVASGEAKAAIVASAINGVVTSKIPATYLRAHPNVTYWLDEAATSCLQA